jgi:hypothetical protein
LIIPFSPFPYSISRGGNTASPFSASFYAGIVVGGDNAGIFLSLPFAGIITCKSFVKGLDK